MKNENGEIRKIPSIIFMYYGHPMDEPGNHKMGSGNIIFVFCLRIKRITTRNKQDRRIKNNNKKITVLITSD